MSDEPEGPEEQGEHDRIYEYGRWGRAEQAEEKERFRMLMHRLDVESALDDLEESPGAYEVYHEVVVRFRWSEIFQFADGVLDAIEYVDGDPIGAAIDAYLEPRYEGDVSEVLSLKTRAEYEEDAVVEVYRQEREIKTDDNDEETKDDE